MAEGFDITTDAVVEERSGDTDGVYANQTAADEMGTTLHSVRGDTSDEIDPRKLVRDPTLSELRWYYRRTFAGMLVDKPIDDAFKNGFDFINDNADEAQSLIDQPRYKSGEVDNGNFVDAYKMAKKKARRDGFALVFLGVRDDTDGAHVSPISEADNVDGITHLKVWTVDNLTGSASGQAHEQIEEGTGLDRENYAVRDTGIVINTDPTSPDYETPIGYILDSQPSQFIHADRVRHYTENPEVDGDYDKGRGVARWEGDRRTLGAWEGDSVLVASYDLMKGISKGNWSVMQALYRNASHMYTVTLPEDADEDDQNAALLETRNINSKSSLVFPEGYEVNQHASGSEMDPTDFYEAIFDQVCAVHEMTKSVLFGTQAGTVSGSETDIKNYYSKVERFRTSRAAKEIGEYLTHAKRILDGRTNDDYEFESEIEWGPLFKVDDETRLQMLQTQAQALTAMIGTYVITPDEARELLSEEWAKIDYDALTEDQMDTLDRIRLASSGQGQQALASEKEAGEWNSQTGGRLGGRPEGASQQPEQSGATPAADEAFSEQFMDKLADKVAERVTDGD